MIRYKLNLVYTKKLIVNMSKKKLKVILEKNVVLKVTIFCSIEFNF